MIFIEGPDNSGKTTLIEQLKKDLEESNVDFNTKVGPRGDLVNWEANQQLECHKTIHDRSRVISEIIYGDTLRGGHKVSAQSVEKFYRANPLIVYCRPHQKVILDNRGREQMEGVLENHEKLIVQYDYMMKEFSRFGLYIHEYNWKEPGAYGRVLEVIKNQLQFEFERHCSALKLSGEK